MAPNSKAACSQRAAIGSKTAPTRTRCLSFSSTGRDRLSHTGPRPTIPRLIIRADVRNPSTSVPPPAVSLNCGAALSYAAAGSIRNAEHFRGKGQGNRHARADALGDGVGELHVFHSRREVGQPHFLLAADGCDELRFHPPTAAFVFRNLELQKLRVPRAG